MVDEEIKIKIKTNHVWTRDYLEIGLPRDEVVFIGDEFDVVH